MGKRNARSVSFGMRHDSKSEFMGGNPFHIFQRNEKWIPICRKNISHIFAIISSFCLLMWFWCRMCCRVIRYLFLLFSIVTRGSRRDGKAVYGCQVSDDEENYLRYHFHRRGVLRTSVRWSDVIRPTLQLKRLSLIANYSRLLRLNQAAAIINHMHSSASQNLMFLPSSEHFRASGNSDSVVC